MLSSLKPPCCNGRALAVLTVLSFLRRGEGCLHTENIEDRSVFKVLRIMSAMRDIHEKINSISGTDIEIKYFVTSSEPFVLETGLEIVSLQFMLVLLMKEIMMNGNLLEYPGAVKVNSTSVASTVVNILKHMYIKNTPSS